MSRPLVRRLLLVLFVLASAVAAIAFVQWLRLLPDAQLDRMDKLSSSLGPPVAVAGLAVAIASGLAATRAGIPSRGPAEQAKAVREFLAEQMTPLLAEEATWRDLHPPYLQPIRWNSDTARGRIDELADFLRSLPVRQLVIVGAPGSGKSSMALRMSIDLLAAEDAKNQPVPVMLSLSSWSSDQRLDDWLEATLIRQFPALADARRFGKGAAACAVKQILPVLDGLDELPILAQPDVLRHFRDELAAGRPAVLVCERKAFLAAIKRSGVTLPRAAVVEVQALDIKESAAFLVVGQHQGEARWQEVLQQVRSKPQGGLARLLSSPLAIYLTRVAYEDPRTDPRELVGMRIPDVRAKLMRSYLPAIYGERASRVDGALRSYPPKSAERWHRFLARGMVSSGTTTLSWWQLPTFSPGAMRALSFVAFVVASFFMRIRYGLLTGWLAGISAMLLVHGMRVGTPPARLAPRLRGLSVAVVAGVVAGVATYVPMRPRTSLLVAALAGVWSGLFILIGVVVLLGGLHDPRDDQRLDLRRQLRDDRTVLLSVVAVSALNGARSAFQWSLWSGVQQFARSAVITLVALCAANIGVPWLRFAWARLVLAATGRVPIRLVTFLEDAHRRGVLRRSGTTYEFRHASFLTYLAEPLPKEPPGPVTSGS
ncbi:NACHT domain-containing protein [Micromonospora okii]|uniref:NACHT domain-containing protein n=1 Tax=Micromonospora okii TaxID=1182970 RepID=UPI001E649604|nr:NACHT domain-containing protein [Micromonospora okii]